MLLLARRKCNRRSPPFHIIYPQNKRTSTVSTATAVAIYYSTEPIKDVVMFFVTESSVEQNVSNQQFWPVAAEFCTMNSAIHITSQERQSVVVQLDQFRHTTRDDRQVIGPSL